MRPVFFSFLIAVFALAAASHEAASPSSVDRLSPDEAFDRANALYEQEKYQEALDIYVALVNQGVSSENLFFNLGNAQFKTGRRGQAIAAYHQAAAFAPDNPSIQRNLALARRGIVGAPPSFTSPTERASLRLGLNELALLISGAIWIFCIAQAGRAIWPSQKAEFRWVSLAAAGLGILFAVWLLAHVYYLSKIPGAVVTATTPARFGPFEASKVSFTAPDGLEVFLRDQKEDWRQVEDSDGRVGWIREDQLIPIASRL